MELFLVIGAAVALLAVVGLLFDRGHPRHFRERLDRAREQVAAAVRQRFLVMSCARCYEFEMRLLELSPNGRSVHYQCRHCVKKYRAPAGTPDAAQAVEAWQAFAGLAAEYAERYDPDDADSLGEVAFDAPAAPLPYEQTTRAPIPEAVRGEVWRRDCGRCVECGSKQNLQFDHIIPVSLGGATTVANLQLLCQPSNAAKSDRI